MSVGSASSSSETSSATARVTSSAKATRRSAFGGTTGTVGVRIVVHNNLTANAMWHRVPSFLVLVGHDVPYMVWNLTAWCCTSVGLKSGVGIGLISSKVVLISGVLFNIVECFIIIFKQMLIELEGIL